MIIGFDVDNTLLDYNTFMLAYGQKFELEKFGKLSKIKSYEADFSAAMFDWDKDVENEFWAKYLTQVLFIPPRPLVKETLEYLKKQGHKIYIITSREKKYFADAYGFTKKWLKKYKLPYDKLFVDIQEKGKKCKEEGVDVFIDDNIEFCKGAVNAGVKTLMYHSNRNWDYNENDVIKVHSFTEIKNIIDELSKKGD